MRLGWSAGKYSTTYRAVRTIRVDGKNKTQTVKKFGSEKYICKTYGVTDAKAWAQEQVDLMNQAEKDEHPIVSIDFDSGADLPLDKRYCFNGGYLFLQYVYYDLGLDKICKAIKAKHHFDFDLNAILSRLIYTRIMFPGSKHSSFVDSGRFIEQPAFELHQIYRALSVLASEEDYIQRRLFKNSMKIRPRRTEVIYYDCTNFYFEIEQADGDRQYGVSKENRPLPIVEMGLFMDRDGIPISFCIHPGNTSEQGTMVPLEEKMMEGFGMSRFVVCTDAGLSSGTNRFFNSRQGDGYCRDFVTTQSIKTLKKFLKDWTMAADGWMLIGDDRTDKNGNPLKYDISKLDEEKDLDRIYYKSRWIKEKVTVREDGTEKKVELEQQLIVSYSLKYRNYMRQIRDDQINRALRKIEKNQSEIGRTRPNDPKRFIQVDHATRDGEIADKEVCYLDEEKIADEEKYDGFYAVCTSLDDDPVDIVRVNKHRWQIEECFRIMKSEFEARPVYLSRQERIVAHFMTCFISLIVYRYLEQKLDNRFSCSQIIDTLQEMNFIKHPGYGWQPTYTRTEITDALHDAFGFCTSKQIVPIKKMRNICSQTKKPNV